MQDISKDSDIVCRLRNGPFCLIHNGYDLQNGLIRNDETKNEVEKIKETYKFNDIYFNALDNGNYYYPRNLAT